MRMEKNVLEKQDKCWGGNRCTEKPFISPGTTDQEQTREHTHYRSWLLELHWEATPARTLSSIIVPFL